MSSFSPVTDADLSRARSDPAFRQRLLEQNLEVLLARIKKLRTARAARGDGASQLREGVELAVRLAELIQNAPTAEAGCLSSPCRRSCLFAQPRIRPPSARPRPGAERTAASKYPAR